MQGAPQRPNPGVYVAPQYRGKGLGRAILTAVLEAARELPDLSSVTLSVAGTPEHANRLYVHLGFRVFGVEPRALRNDGRYIEEAHMILEL
jgi:ribosomal protein S18 acetylase RimI-like enzyme